MDGAVDERLSFSRCAAILASKLRQVRCSEVGCHDKDAVVEVDSAALSISASSSGSWDSTESWLRRMAQGPSLFSQLERFGQAGVSALQAATPRESGETANAWFYEVIQDGKSWSLVWGNNHVDNGRQIAVLLQYGHGTGTGGYVAPQDYINPALAPIFDHMAAEGWKVVTR